MGRIKELVRKCQDVVIEYRRDIHKHPELGYKESRTSAKVAEVLESLGIETQRNIGKTGVVGILEGGKPGKVIAIRADMDALPMEEETNLSFASINKGVMHACGHDMHTSILLGCAHVFSEMKEEIPGTIKFVFQPAEENNPTGGAPGMIQDGVLENPKVDAMMALHVWPQLETGIVAIKEGAMMGASDRIFITIKGKSSHGSAPEDGIDAIAIAGNVISVLQTIVSRNVGALDSSVISIGKIYGGSRYNVIADKVVLEGTVRNLNPEIRNKMPERIGDVVKGITSAMGGDYEFEYVKGYPPVINDGTLTNLVYHSLKEILGEGAIISGKPALGGEDFAFFSEKLPTAYFWLGVRPKDISFENFAPIHNPKFSPDEKAIPIGIEILVKAACNFLNQ